MEPGQQEIESVRITNPRAIRKIIEAKEQGHGRSFTEAAENLIFDGAEKHSAPGEPRAEPASAA